MSYVESPLGTSGIFSEALKAHTSDMRGKGHDALIPSFSVIVRDLGRRHPGLVRWLTVEADFLMYEISRCRFRIKVLLL